MGTGYKQWLVISFLACKRVSEVYAPRLPRQYKTLLKELNSELSPFFGSESRRYLSNDVSTKLTTLDN